MSSLSRLGYLKEIVTCIRVVKSTYWYSFSATTKKIYKESLYHAPKGKKALVFFREGQEYTFTEDKARRNLIAQTVAHKQLFFSVACVMNDFACIRAMRWFREVD